MGPGTKGADWSGLRHIDHGQLSIDWCFTVAVSLHSSHTNTLTDHVTFNKRSLWKTATHTHWCIANKEIYMLTFLDKHNNYFTLMMLIMGLPVKVSCRLECDLSLMSSIMRRQANIGQNLCHFHAFMRIVCAHIFVYRGSKLPFWKPSTIRQRRLQMRKPSAKSKVHVSQTHV